MKPVRNILRDTSPSDPAERYAYETAKHDSAIESFIGADEGSIRPSKWARAARSSTEIDLIVTPAEIITEGIDQAVTYKPTTLVMTFPKGELAELRRLIGGAA